MLPIPLLIFLAVARSPDTRHFEVEGELGDVLARIGQEFNQPIGLVEDSRLLDACAIDSLTLTNEDLEEALSMITHTCPSYTWKRFGTSVFLLPRRQTTRLVDLKISKYMASNATAYDATHEILVLPELQKWLRANGLSLNEVFLMTGTGPPTWRTVRFSVALSQAKLVDVLDALGRSTGHMFWRIAWNTNDKSIGIYLW